MKSTLYTLVLIIGLCNINQTSARPLDNKTFWKNLTIINTYHTFLHIINGASQAFLPTKLGVIVGLGGSCFIHNQANKRLRRTNRNRELASSEAPSIDKFQYHPLFATLPLYMIGQFAGYTLKQIIKKHFYNTSPYVK